MPAATYTLQYDGEIFAVSADDHARLTKIYTSGLAVSSALFTFTPVGATDEVTIAVGSGAQFVLKKDAGDAGY